MNVDWRVDKAIVGKVADSVQSGILNSLTVALQG
jgi:hypothetical protein